MAKKIDYNKVNRESLEKVQYDLIAMLQNETSNIRGNHNPCCNYIELKALADTIDTINRLLKLQRKCILVTLVVS